MDTSIKNGELNLALQVALQTMKERCVALQKRLNTVEEENLQLKDRIENKRNNSPPTVNNGSNSGAAELFQLRLQLAEMQRQKTQMTDHISMVSEENRKLWSRLSQVAKEQDNMLSCNKDIEDVTQNAADILLKERGASARAALTQQNLIRSKTFTQHSPNPNLRHKLVGDCHEVTEINDGESDDTDIDMYIEKCYEDMLELHEEAKNQQLQLNTVLNVLEEKLVSKPCPECVKKAQKPETADKSLETDDSISELKPINNKTLQLDLVQSINESSQPRLNIIQEKLQADAMDKTCPMCGRIFNSIVPFDAFRQHVEQHFIDDNSTEIENSIDRNFEFVSHTVGDF